MMNDANDRRLALQNQHVERLERWFERKMDVLDEQLMSNRVTQEEYDDMVKQLQRDFDEDYADIFGD